MTLKTVIQFVLFGERGIVLNKKNFQSLRMQLLCAVLISFFIGVLIFTITFLFGTLFLDRTVYGNSFAEKMADQQFAKLQNYVNEEAISLNNLHRLNAWCSRGEKVYLTLYKDNVLIYEFPFSGEKKSEKNILQFSPDMEDPNNEYMLILQEGVKVRSFLYYYAGDIFYFGMMILSGVFAFLAFSLCFITLINRKVSYIKLLKQELDILSGGQLEYVVTINGKDELSELALGIDQMRRSIMKHQEIENQMRVANSELITAMSHDLRTPLTSLLAYLEIIERKKYCDEEQMYSLIHKSIGQTMRIKNMADKLFEYFLVYATEWESTTMELIDVDQLFCQILEDYAYSLESNGMIIEKEFFQVSGQIKVNIELLQRALDNLYSNLLKYANPQQTIKFSYKREDNNFFLFISNGICLNHKKKESTSIGLNTCQRIIEYHGGSFYIEEKKNRFHVTISIPFQE